LVYRNINNYQLRVGGLVNPDLWQFDLKELQGVPEKEGWFFGSAEFDLSGYYRVDNQYRFLLSLPYTELTEVKDGLAISAIKLELIRDPLNFKSFWVKLFNKLRL
jgi:hypothetical protein